MALFKQYNALSKQVADGNEITYDQVAQSLFPKPTIKASNDNLENQDPQKAATKSKAAAKGSKAIVMPKYPQMPSAAMAQAMMGSSGSGEDASEDDDDNVMTLDGAQLKSLIGQYASQVLKDELANVLATLTKNQ